jgi:hypothetical protein
MLSRRSIERAVGKSYYCYVVQETEQLTYAIWTLRSEV